MIPYPEVGALLNALGAAAEHSVRHLGYDWHDDGHKHAECSAEGHSGLCPRCEDWHFCCQERERAVEALTSYALALRAKRP